MHRCKVTQFLLRLIIIIFPKNFIYYLYQGVARSKNTWEVTCCCCAATSAVGREINIFSIFQKEKYCAFSCICDLICTKVMDHFSSSLAKKKWNFARAFCGPKKKRVQQPAEFYLNFSFYISASNKIRKMQFLSGDYCVYCLVCLFTFWLIIKKTLKLFYSHLKPHSTAQTITKVK